MANQPAGFNFPEYSDLKYVIGFAVLYQSIEHVITSFVRPIYTPLVKCQNDPAARERYVKKSCESTGKALVYLIHLVWGACILYDTDYVPAFLLGSGSFESSIKNLPFTPCPPNMHMLALSFLGMFSGHFFSLMGQQDRPDFNEMLTHHICEMALTFGMIFANNRALGVVIAWQQTFCDVPVSISRVTASLPYLGVMLASYTVLMLLWFWTRLFNFSIFTYRVTTEMYYPEGLEQFNPHTRLYALFLGILLLMQVYWTVLLLQMLHAFTKTGATTDLQMQVKQGKKEK